MGKVIEIVFLYLVCQYFKIGMEDPDPKTRQMLSQAYDFYQRHEYIQSRKLLAQIKTTHISIELNSLLCEYKESPHKLPSILRKIMDILVTVNIKIYKDRPQKGKKRTLKISHQLYFWNIVVLSQLLSNPEITELICTYIGMKGNEALFYLDGLRTQTSLMIIYQMLKLMESRGRMASCISLIEKQNRLMGKVKKLTPEEQEYRFMNQILFCKVLLNLGMIDGGRVMYMMKFNQNLEEPKEGELTDINGLHIGIHQQLLHAQIEFHSKNYQHCLKILSEITSKLDSLGKNKQFIKHVVDHNIALVLASYRKVAPAKLMIGKMLTFLSSDKDFHCKNEKAGMIAKCRDNLIVTSLMQENTNYEAPFQYLKNHHNCYSYKLNYRKAQLCLNYYNQLLKNPERVLTYKQMHDFYQTVYFYPNQPYFQQKGKNKNPNYTNNRFFYKRYILQECQYAMGPGEIPEEEKVQLNKKVNGSKDLAEVKKDPSKEKRGGSNKKKGKKQEEEKVKADPVKQEIFAVREPLNKLKQILTMCEWYLKQALVVLQKQKNIIVNLQDEQKGLTQQVNEKLYSESLTYKSSIYSILCYVFLCKHQWQQTVHYATLYQSFQKQYQLNNKNSPHQSTYYNILTYKLEAYCQLNKMDKAYDTLHNLLGLIDYTDTSVFECCTSTVQESGETYFQKQNQYNNFGYNLAVLHSRDNKIPEAYNSIQKLLQQMRQIPTNPKANLPLSVIQLLTHYNLRTSNQLSALQLIKRRRILNLPGAIGHYQPILNITK